LKEEKTSRILRTLPSEKAFYFFTSIGNYTGERAISFKEFMDKINQVTVKSLEFHLYRGDFEKWIAETLEDQELKRKIANLRNRNYSGTALKEQLYKTLTMHYQKIISKS
jgi:hypothetical protein